MDSPRSPRKYHQNGVIYRARPTPLRGGTKGYSHVKTSVEQIDGGRLKLTVTIDPERVDAEIKRGYREVAGQVKIPGFRPGKAPRARVDAVLGADYVLAEATEALIGKTYVQALDEAGLRPVGKIDFDDIEEPIADGTEFTYALSLTPRPVLTLTSSDVEIKMVPRDVTDAEVDEQVDMTRDRFARLETVEAREIVAGDFVSISFESTLDGEPYEGSKIDQYLYETGKGMMPEEFENALVGAKPGDKLSVDFAVEDTGQNSEFAGKPLHFDIEVHDIKEKVLPEVDEEFAKMVGFDTVEEMREEIRSYIQSQKDQSYERIRDERLVGALADKLEGDMPEELVTARRDSLMREFEDQLKRSNLELKTYFQGTGIDPNQWEQDMEMQARISVGQDLALEALAREKGLTATEADFDEEFAGIGEALQMTAEQARKQWTELGLLTSAADQIARRKALEWLTENATVTIDESAF